MPPGSRCAAKIGIALPKQPSRMPLPVRQLPDLIAHRGNAAEYPENTLPAIRSALDLGVRYVEFDVQLFADRQPMLLNDSSLKRTAGVDRDALEMTWHELAEISVNDARRIGSPY